MQAFPGQVNTGTTATAAQTSGSVPLRLDLSYIKTVHGMLKCAQILLNLLGFICIMCSHLSTNSRCEWFNMVSMIGFWTTGILLGFYLFHVIEKLHKVPWFKIEFYFCAVETACYLLASALVAALAGASESLGVAGFFGFCAMCAYGFDTWMKFKALKSGEYPQGQPPSSKPVSTVGSPAGY